MPEMRSLPWLPRAHPFGQTNRFPESKDWTPRMPQRTVLRPDLPSRVLVNTRQPSPAARSTQPTDDLRPRHQMHQCDNDWPIQRPVSIQVAKLTGRHPRRGSEARSISWPRGKTLDKRRVDAIKHCRTGPAQCYASIDPNRRHANEPFLSPGGQVMLQAIEQEPIPCPATGQSHSPAGSLSSR